MKRVERTATIPAPPADIFALLSDLDRIGEWQLGVESVERTTPGPIGPGSKARLVRDMMGQRIVAPLVITEFDPPARLALESTVSGVNVRALLEFAPTDGGTASELRFSTEIRGRSVMTGLLEGVVARAAATDIDATLERLTQLFDRG